MLSLRILKYKINWKQLRYNKSHQSVRFSFILKYNITETNILPLELLQGNYLEIKWPISYMTHIGWSWFDPLIKTYKIFW